MKKLYLFVLLVGLFYNTIEAQNQNQDEDEYLNNPVDGLFPETPDITQFHQQSSLPINLYTGKVDVKVPIYEIKSGNITIPISLDYDTSGNKVDELSSRVGLGWTLNAGGSIAHVVKGLPDAEFLILNGKNRRGNLDDNNYTLDAIGYHRRIYDYDDTKHFNNQRDSSLPNHQTPWNTDPINNNRLVFSYDIDSSPDLYHVAAPGLNAKFIVVSNDPIKPTSTINKGIHNFLNRSFRAVFLEDNGLKMDNNVLKYAIYDKNHVMHTTNRYPQDDERDKQHEARYLERFKVINTNGLIYEFKLGNVSESESELTPGYGRAGTRRRNFTKRVNSWDLHSITDPITKKTVRFEYDVYEIRRKDYTPIVNFRAPGIYNTTNLDFLFFGPQADIYSDVNMKVFPRVTRLRRIIFDGGEVEFKYDFVREDGYDNRALSEVILKNSFGNKVKGYRLRQWYFDAKDSNCSGMYCKRLKLLEVREVDKELDIEDQEFSKRYVFEYNESIKLPKSRYSHEKDYMGYYNRNGAGYFLEDHNVYDPFGRDHPGKHPKLYFYPNQAELSVLPFKKKNVTDPNKFREISPYGVTLEPDLQGTLATSLKKITYPTGGSLELEYENNEFFFEGHNYKAPGLRVRKQKLKDGEGNTQEFIYEYKNDQGNSSGTFVNMPVFGLIANRIADVNNMPAIGHGFQFHVYTSPLLNDVLTQGNLVGYSQITERQINNGKTVYKYTSPKDFPNRQPSKQHRGDLDFLIKNSAFPAENIVDQEIRRGKLIEKSIYAENGDILQKENREYTYRSSFSGHKIVDLKAAITGATPYFYDYYDFDKALEETIPKNWLRATVNWEIRRNLTQRILKSDFLENGRIDTRESIFYDRTYPLVTRRAKFINNEAFETIDYKYPFNYTSSEATSLVNLHKIDTPMIVERQNSDGKMTFENSYQIINALPYLSSINTKKGNTSSTDIEFEEYDLSNGNVLQYAERGERTTSIIWGYNRTVPIAKIENATYDQVSSYVSGLQTKSNADTDHCRLNTCKEQILRQALQNLRNALPNAMVTSYTYDPMIGITSITDPRGYTTYYEYDEFNRLVSTRDADEHLISTTEYKYKK